MLRLARHQGIPDIRALVALAMICSWPMVPSLLAQSENDAPPIPRGMQSVFEGDSVELLNQELSKKWEPISFGGEGDCQIEQGVLTIASGDPMSGMVLEHDVPKVNYEVQFEARRTGGIDFFTGLTFPIQDSHCCWIVGGWAGSVVGLSNIDDEDASSNETCRLMSFEDERWYRFRLRVTPSEVVCWIDGDCVIKQSVVGKKISLRGDTLSCAPFGFCTFQTSAEVKNLKLRRIRPMTETPGKK